MNSFQNTLRRYKNQRESLAKLQNEVERLRFIQQERLKIKVCRLMKDFGIGEVQTLVKDIRRAFNATSTHNTIDPKKKDEGFRLLKQGKMSGAAVARKLGVHYMTIQQWKNKLGLVRKRLS